MSRPDGKDRDAVVPHRSGENGPVIPPEPYAGSATGPYPGDEDRNGETMQDAREYDNLDTPVAEGRRRIIEVHYCVPEQWPSL